MRRRAHGSLSSSRRSCACRSSCAYASRSRARLRGPPRRVDRCRARPGGAWSFSKHLPPLRGGGVGACGAAAGRPSRRGSGMLSVIKIADAEYPLGQVALGIEDYYLGVGEAPGVWAGRWSTELGLEGVVEAGAAAGAGERGRSEGRDVVAGGAAGPEGERVRRDLLGAEERVAAVGVRARRRWRRSCRSRHVEAVAEALGVPGGQGGGVPPADRRGPHPGGNAGVGGGDVRAPHIAGGRPAAAHPLHRPERGVTRRRLLRERGWRRPVPLGQGGRVGLPGAAAPRS